MKKVVCFLAIFLIILLINQVSFASTDVFADTNLKGVNSGISNFGNRGVGKAINTVIGLLQIAGTGISILMVSILGVKYMLASVGEKAEIKKQAVPIVIGAVLLFGAVNLLGIVETFSNDVVNKP